MAKKCRKLTLSEKTEWDRIQLLSEVERIKAEESFVKKIMEVPVEKFPIEEIKFTDIQQDLKDQGIDPTQPSKSLREPTAKEKRTNELIPGKPELTEERADAIIHFFGEYVSNPNVETAWLLTKELRKDTRADRAEKLRDRAQQLIVEEGLEPEQAMKTAIKEALSGKYPTLKTEYLSELTDDLRSALFSKVYHVLQNEPFEMASTLTALTNALTGRPIPRDLGITGRSAWTRLQRVFGEEPLALQAIEKTEPLEDIVEGVYRVAGQPPIPIDQEMADYLRGLKDVGKPLPLFERAPVSRLDKIVEATFAKVLPQLTVAEKQTISRILKELLMSPIDIGNFLRANKASFDFSFWRQVKTLALGHPSAFYRANIEAWKALWSQKSAEANWEWIKTRPSYPYYVEMVERTGNDFLRLFQAPKGTPQWQAAEEFGQLTAERLIPRITAWLPWVKISGRSFVAGTNTDTIMVYDELLVATLRRAEKIASGEIKLKEGESFGIQNEMDEYGKYIADLSQRASLGQMRVAGPTINALFFSARSKLGRLLTPRHLISSNPRVRAMAWKDLGLFVGAIGGIVMLGKWLDWWDVDTDPRSGEFMSVRIGNLRIDPWAGNRQYVVLYARLITGTGVGSVTGAEYEADPLKAFQSFIRTSLSPFATTTLDFWTGKDFLGDEVDIANKEQWLERLSPFAVQDIWEAFEEGWVKGNIAIVPAILGEGVQTYTGDWNENFEKLGTPKYQENTAYGITEPVYDVNDLWADTVARFEGVSFEELTEEKGYPEFIRSMVETRNELLPMINDLPNTPLYQMNGDPSLEEPTFKEYYQMWKDREKIVKSGDEEALKAFDSDERTDDAYKGNITQAQYSLLTQYHSQLGEDKETFLEDHPELREQPREEWLKAHPKENAQLAVWGATSRGNRVDLETSAAYNFARKIIDELEIPDSALLGIPPAKLGNDFKGYLDLLNSGISSGSDEAHFYRLTRPEYEAWHTINWHGEGAAPAKIEVTERYSTNRVRDLLELYNDLPTEGKDRVRFRQANSLLDAYFVHVKDYTPVINSGWDSIKFSQILEWYKLGKARDGIVTSEKTPQNPAEIWIPIRPGVKQPKTGGGALSDILD